MKQTTLLNAGDFGGMRIWFKIYIDIKKVALESTIEFNIHLGIFAKFITDNQSK